MLFFVDPYAPEPEYLDPEDAYVEFKRREYIAALEERQRRVQFERELEREEQRHKLMLASIARQEAERRQREQQRQIQRQRELQQLQHLTAHEQAQRRQRLQPEQRPSQEEILNRRRKRQEEEEARSRDLHKQILSQIFGVPFDEGDETERPESTSAARKAPGLTESVGDRDEGRAHSLTVPKTSANEKFDAPPARAAEPPLAPSPTKPSQTAKDAPESPTDASVDAHWSNAPERARALAEITSLGRIFAALKNTFVFPEGPLERLAGNDTPRLAYNSTNTAIHAYEHALSELLSKLDTIESHGFKGVREARKQLVLSIEQELSALEKKISERLVSFDAPVTKGISIPIEDASTRSEEPSRPQDTQTQDVVQDQTLRGEAPQDPATQPDASAAVSEQVQGSTLDQKPTSSATEVARDSTTELHPVTQHDAPTAASEDVQDSTPDQKPTSSATEIAGESATESDPTTQHEVSATESEQVKDFTSEQEPTNSAGKMAGETATKLDATVEAPEPLSDTRTIPEASVPNENPSVTLDRNPDGEPTVTEHVAPATPADDAPHDEDSEVEDAVEVMLEPQRTAVPAGEEHEYELV